MAQGMPHGSQRAACYSLPSRFEDAFLIHCKRRRRPDGKWRRQKAGSKLYSYGGWSAFALGNILRFIAMRFAAQTVLSGLGSLQFVVIPVASRFMLGIRASASTVLGVTVVLLGARTWVARQLHTCRW
jgi:hypothetical protein